MGKHSKAAKKNDGVSRENKMLWSPDTDDRTFDHFSPTETDIGHGENLQQQFINYNDKQGKSKSGGAKVVVAPAPTPAISAKPATMIIKSTNVVVSTDATSSNNANNSKKKQQKTRASGQDRENEKLAVASSGNAGKSGGKNKVHQSSFSYSSTLDSASRNGQPRRNNNDLVESGQPKSQHLYETANVFDLLAVDD